MISEYLQNPIVIATLSGLALGLFAVFIILVKTRIYKNELEDELRDARYDYRRLEDQLNTQMRVSLKAQEDLVSEKNNLLKRIENLELSLDTLSKKPGRKDLKNLILMEKTLEKYLAETPSASLLWDKSKTEAEQELKETETGLAPLLKKALSPNSKKTGNDS